MADAKNGRDKTNGKHRDGERGRSRRLFLKATGAAGLALAAPWLPFPAAAAGTDNPIRAENARAGDAGWQLGRVAYSGQIEGYTAKTSYNVGEKLKLHVSTVDPAFTVTLYRIGWYGGAGARRMTEPVSVAGGKRPAPAPDPITGLVDAGWPVSWQFKIPRDWVSGVYLAKLEARPSGYQRYAVFVIRDDARPATYLMQASVTTYQAYNEWGGKSLYGFNSTNEKPAVKVSFNRPYTDCYGAGQFLLWEINMVRFLEREGYDVKYATNIDLDANAGLLTPVRSFLSVGHDEYWSWKMRANVEAARARGAGLGFFSSNTCYWQIRLEPSPVDGQARRAIVCHKYTALETDPFMLDANRNNNRLVTTQWRAWPVSRPEDALIGVMYHGDPVAGDIVVSDAGHWVYQGTGLRNGDKLFDLLGYESDASFGNAPAGTHVIAHSPDPFGYSDMTVYTWPTGAVVFATGSMQFTWGLDAYGGHGIDAATRSAAEIMTRNVLARLALPAAT